MLVSLYSLSRRHALPYPVFLLVSQVCGLMPDDSNRPNCTQLAKLGNISPRWDIISVRGLMNRAPHFTYKHLRYYGRLSQSDRESTTRKLSLPPSGRRGHTPARARAREAGPTVLTPSELCCVTAKRGCSSPSLSPFLVAEVF